MIRKVKTPARITMSKKKGKEGICVAEWEHETWKIETENMPFLALFHDVLLMEIISVAYLVRKLTYVYLNCHLIPMVV